MQDPQNYCSLLVIVPLLKAMFQACLMAHMLLTYHFGRQSCYTKRELHKHSKGHHIPYVTSKQHPRLDFRETSHNLLLLYSRNHCRLSAQDLNNQLGKMGKDG